MRTFVARLSGRALLALGVFLAAAPAAADAQEESRLELREGDRVVLLGGTLIEREQAYGYWETMLTAAFPERNVSFRNLGWSGDTVWAESRGVFDPPEAGYARMVEQVRDLKPTLIVLGYGGNEAFAGDAGRARFLQQLQKLVDDLSPTGARFAVLLPLPMETLGPPWPSPDEYNAQLETYRGDLVRFAAERRLPVIDLTTPAAEEQAAGLTRLTDNGLHLTAGGYWATAHRLRDQLSGADTTLVLPQPQGDRIDRGPPSEIKTDADRLETLRNAIQRKNELYFHRWRPQNITYLFLFRKHEQGNNAVEIPQFDPLVEEWERKIAELRRPL